MAEGAPYRVVYKLNFRTRKPSELKGFCIYDNVKVFDFLP